MGLIIAIGVLIVVISSIVDNRIIKNSYYTIESSKLKKNCRIVFLSDLHGNDFGAVESKGTNAADGKGTNAVESKDPTVSTNSGSGNEKLIQAVKATNPDLILVGGDMITAKANKVESENWDSAFALIEGLKEYPIFYGIGNHEYRMDIYREDFGDAFDKYMGRLKDAGVTVLYNEQQLLDEYGIDIKGLAIDRKYYKRFAREDMPVSYLEECVSGIGEVFSVMLAHNPEYFPRYKEVADLTLSGHVHGGIARLPILGGVISPRLTLFPKYDGGLFRADDRAMIISRGLGSHTLPFRVFNPCELCIIDLKKK